MDTGTDALAAEVRAKRYAIDNDLERLRVRVNQADPRAGAERAALGLLALAAGTSLVWWWARRRRSVGSLQQLLVRSLRDLYRTERTLLPALERMQATATNADLRAAFEQHGLESRGHVARLERAFRAIGVRPREGSSDAADSIVADGERLLKRKVDPDVRDAWLIATAQRIEHLEISGYGTARTFARTLGHVQAADLLQETLEDERAADEKLTRLAERFVNPQSIR